MSQSGTTLHQPLLNLSVVVAAGHRKDAAHVTVDLLDLLEILVATEQTDWTARPVISVHQDHLHHLGQIR